MTYLKATGFVALLVLTSACAGPREAAEPAEEADVLPTPAVEISDYEDFDPTPYEDVAIRPSAAVEHDVPERLMEGRADEGITSQVQGFRIQIHSSLDKGAAVTAEEALRTWLRSEQAPPMLGGDDPAIYNVYMQPYYRIRVGNYPTRQSAERGRQALAQRYPDAVIVPDTVIITR